MSFKLLPIFIIIHNIQCILLMNSFSMKNVVSCTAIKIFMAIQILNLRLERSQQHNHLLKKQIKPSILGNKEENLGLFSPLLIN